MAVNELNFNQLSTVLNAIVSQATGNSNITPTNTGEFVSVAQVGLKAGYDPVLGAISQVLSNTIFSTRPYSAKFKGLEVSNRRYGAITRKLNTVDKNWENDARMTLTDGQSVDQYTVNKPEIIQTNFYGANVYEKSLTIFRDQLDNAFKGPDEFGEFLAMITQNANDMIIQAHENTARATIANLMGGVIDYADARTVKLVTLYNNASGASLTPGNVFAPENFAPFIRWAYAMIMSVSDALTERTSVYHTNLTGKPINRHTPKEYQNLYMYAPYLRQVDAQVKTVNFNNGFMNLGNYEAVNFWQAIGSPDAINVKATRLNPADGTLTTAAEAVSTGNIFGVLFDREAAGFSVFNQWSASSPFNAKGGYSNMFWHFTERYWNDFTENAVIFLLA